MRRFNFNVSVGDWPLLNRILNLLSNRTLPLVSADITSLNTVKADKVSDATDGNFAGLNTSGNLTDSGKKAADFQPAGDYQPLDADLTAIAALGFTSLAFLKKTADDTWGLDTTVYLTTETDPVAMAYLDQVVKTTSSPTFTKVITLQSWGATLRSPNDLYQVSANVLLPFDVLYNATITSIEVSCNANPTTEITGDLKYADAFIGLANPTLISAIDTTEGVFSSGAISVSVAAGKVLYIAFDDAPDVAITDLIIKIRYTY